MIRAAAAWLCLAVPAAAVNVAGTAAFSRLDVSARAEALGGGITAADDGPGAAAANPAGLARLGVPVAAVLSSAVLPLGRSLNDVAVAGWATPSTAASFGVMVLGDGGDLEVRRANTDAPDRLASAVAQAYTVAGAWRIFPPMELGLSVKLLLDAVADRSAWGFTGDAGVIYHPVPRAALSFVVQDAGGPDVTGFNWSTDAHEEYARVSRAGGALDLNPLLLVAEVRELGTPRPFWSGGAELDVLKPLTLRAGLEDGRIAAGFGARLRLNRRTALSLDYALARESVGDAAYAHRLALTAGWVDDARPRGRLTFPTETPEAAAPAARPAPLLRWPGL